MLQPKSFPDTANGFKRWRKLAASTCAAGLILASSVQTAFATIDNTATVTGTPRAGTLPPNIQATEQVDVIDAAPGLSIVKTHVFAPGGDVNGDGNFDVGDTVLYSYVVTNTGNVTLSEVSIADTHEGSGSLVFANPTLTTDNGTAAAGQSGDSVDDSADANWDTLGPLDVVTFTSTYVITQTDFDNGGGGTDPIGSKDNDIDNSAVANAVYDDGTTTTPVASAPDTDTVPLDINPSLIVTKVADIDTNVPEGTTITYTYEVENNGNVAIRNIDVSDSHQGSGTAPVPVFSTWVTNTGGSTASGSTITILFPGDRARFTATYVVTQDDVDTLQ